MSDSAPRPIIFDVCDDYSLSPSDLDRSPSGYVWKSGSWGRAKDDADGMRGLAGFCRKTGELHYFIQTHNTERQG